MKQNFKVKKEGKEEAKNGNVDAEKCWGGIGSFLKIKFHF